MVVVVPAVASIDLSCQAKFTALAGELQVTLICIKLPARNALGREGAAQFDACFFHGGKRLSGDDHFMPTIRQRLAPRRRLKRFLSLDYDSQRSYYDHIGRMQSAPPPDIQVDADDSELGQLLAKTAET